MDNFYIAFWMLLSVIGGAAIWQHFHSEKLWEETEKAWKEAEEAKEKKRDEITNTPASDLVDAAPNAGELRADAGAIAGKFRKRLRNRVENILSGNSGAGTAGSGGSGD
jgi:hypothetical protein